MIARQAGRLFSVVRREAELRNQTAVDRSQREIDHGTVRIAAAELARVVPDPFLQAFDAGRWDGAHRAHGQTALAVRFDREVVGVPLRAQIGLDLVGDQDLDHRLRDRRRTAGAARQRTDHVVVDRAREQRIAGPRSDAIRRVVQLERLERFFDRGPPQTLDLRPASALIQRRRRPDVDDAERPVLPGEHRARHLDDQREHVVAAEEVASRRPEAARGRRRRPRLVLVVTVRVQLVKLREVERERLLARAGVHAHAVPERGRTVDRDRAEAVDEGCGRPGSVRHSGVDRDTLLRSRTFGLELDDVRFAGRRIVGDLQLVQDAGVERRRRRERRHDQRMDVHREDHLTRIGGREDEHVGDVGARTALREVERVLMIRRRRRPHAERDTGERDERRRGERSKRDTREAHR